MSDAPSVLELNQLLERVTRERAAFMEAAFAELDRGMHVVLAARDLAVLWQKEAVVPATPKARRHELGFASLGVMLLLNEWAEREVRKINRKAAENV